MKYLSIDIETTNVNPLTGQIVEIGMIIGDTEKELSLETCPTFHSYVYDDADVDVDVNGQLLWTGCAFALNMNIEKLLKIEDLYQKRKYNSLIETEEEKTIQLLREDEITMHIEEFFHSNFNILEGEKITIVGKNFGNFDNQFLNQLPGWKLLSAQFCSYSFVDVGSMVLNVFLDERVPSLDLCRERAGLTPQPTSHNALEDAFSTAEVFQALMNKQKENQ